MEDTDWGNEEPPEAYDEWDRVHAYDNAEAAYERDQAFFEPDEQAIMNAYERQFDGP